MMLCQSRLVLAVLAGLASQALARDTAIKVQVKLLNEWTGRPIPNQTIILFAAKGEIGSAVPQEDIFSKLHAKTGTDGIAKYLLSPPLPSRLLLYLGALRGCSRKGDAPKQNQYRLEEVVISGVIIPGTCVPRDWHGKFHWQDVRAQPGEIIVFTSPPARAPW